MATAIVTAAKDRNIAIPAVNNFDSPLGKGVLGKVEGRHIALGNLSFMQEFGLDGTDVAMESSAITLLKRDLRGIVRARLLWRATMRNIRQNLFLAFFYNATGVPVAAGILYPSFGILLSPVIAAAAMALSSVSVVANALRLNWARIDLPPG